MLSSSLRPPLKATVLGFSISLVFAAQAQDDSVIEEVIVQGHRAYIGEFQPLEILAASLKIRLFEVIVARSVLHGALARYAQCIVESKGARPWKHVYILGLAL